MLECLLIAGSLFIATPNGTMLNIENGISRIHVVLNARKPRDTDFVTIKNRYGDSIRVSRTDLSAVGLPLDAVVFTSWCYEEK